MSPDFEGWGNAMSGNQYKNMGLNALPADALAQYKERPGSKMLKEVARLIEERGRYYGPPLRNHERIAAFWNVQLGDKLKADITPGEVVQMMIALKLARLIESPKHEDSMKDLAGYSACLLEIELNA